MAFRPALCTEKPPRCASCGRAHPHAKPMGSGAFRWTCAACEYRESYPDAPLIPAAPNARRALPLQAEVLFTD